MDFLIEPWAHQLEAINRAKERKNFAYLMDMGTGKTAACINTLRFKFAAYGRILKTVIFSPPITLQNWKREWAAHSKIESKNVIILNGSQEKRVELFNKTKDTPKIYITNYESLLMENLFSEMLHWHVECLVLDESHKIKDSKTKRTKAALKLGQGAPHKYIMTGTAVLNSPMDIFPQFQFMLGGWPESSGYMIKKFWEFRNKYMVDLNAGMPRDKYFPNWQIKPDTISQINRTINSYGFRVKKEDCLTLPPLVRQKIYVELSPTQRKHYEEMKKDFITFVNDKACVANLAITKALRLQQIISGHIALDDGSIKKIGPTPRQEALKELLEELTPNHKVLVWAVFKENYEQVRKVCEDLKIQFVEVHGEISEKRKFEAVDNFNQNPHVRVFLGHPGSGGIGINLISASYSVFYSRNFSLEQDLQAEARNYRGGSEIHSKITRIDLVSPDTLDEHILKCLEQKQAISEATLKNIAKELENGK